MAAAATAVADSVAVAWDGGPGEAVRLVVGGTLDPCCCSRRASNTPSKVAKGGSPQKSVPPFRLAVALPVCFIMPALEARRSPGRGGCVTVAVAPAAVTVHTCTDQKAAKHSI